MFTAFGCGSRPRSAVDRQKQSFGAAVGHDVATVVVSWPEAAYAGADAFIPMAFVKAQNFANNSTGAVAPPGHHRGPYNRTQATRITEDDHLG
jgi:hypothetical protein